MNLFVTEVEIELNARNGRYKIGYFKIFFFCTVNFDIIIEHKPTKCKIF